MAAVALAFSGGLDTSYAVLALRQQGHDVTTVAVDTGGFSENDLHRISTRSIQLGAVRHVAADAVQELWDRFFAFIVRGNVLRGGVYPVAVGAERFLQAEKLVEAAREHGCTAVAHGCTGAGNDQVRFDVALRALGPDLEILAPIRAGHVTRVQSTAALREAGIEVEDKTTKYSVNAGLVGTTVGGGPTHDPWEEIPEEAFAEAGASLDPDARETEIAISFLRGLPAALDGRDLAPLELVAELDRRARPLGVGRGSHLGDTILGIKGRIGFVAPAATVLIAAHRELEKLVLTKRQLDFKNRAGAYWGDLLHEGLYPDPVCRDLERAIESSQERVTGDVRLRLRRLGCDVLGVRSPHALVRDAARYGEESGLWDAHDAEGFAKLYGFPARLHGESG